MRTAVPLVRTTIRSSATGATHLTRGLGNEDAVAAVPLPGGGIVVAVADGHSDPRCVRARRGADLAVAAAVAGGGGADGGYGERVVAAWRAAVDADRAADGLPRIAYGSTLLACRCDDRGIAVVQVGDGDVVVVDREGVARRPLRPPVVDVPGATASLADDDVLDLLVEALLPWEEAPHVVLLASDGLDNAYPTAEALLATAADVAARLRADGGETLQADVDDLVARAAAMSGDDASAVVLELTERPGP